MYTASLSKQINRLIFVNQDPCGCLLNQKHVVVGFSGMMKKKYPSSYALLIFLQITQSNVELYVKVKSFVLSPVQTFHTAEISVLLVVHMT